MVLCPLRLAANCCTEMQMHLWLRGVHDTCHVSGDTEMVQGSRPDNDDIWSWRALRTWLWALYPSGICVTCSPFTPGLTCSYECIYWVVVPTSAHGHTENVISEVIWRFVVLLKDALINNDCSSRSMFSGWYEGVWYNIRPLRSTCWSVLELEIWTTKELLKLHLQYTSDHPEQLQDS